MENSKLVNEQMERKTKMSKRKTQAVSIELSILEMDLRSSIDTYKLGLSRESMF